VTACDTRRQDFYDDFMSTAEAPAGDGRRKAAAVRRRERERALLAATRRIFDERGSGDAQIEDVAAAVGINRALVYRAFTGKEELFALTLCEYLDELRAELAAAVAAHDAPRDRLTAVVSAFVDYAGRYPAFVDCAHALLRRTGPELFGEISEGALVKLGTAISGCLLLVSDTLQDGVDRGDFAVADPQLTANMLYASGLGAMRLARVGILVNPGPGVPTLGTISHEQVRDHVVAAALAFAESSDRTR
jgi:AcrR family transcriptional regulator